MSAVTNNAIVFSREDYRRELTPSEIPEIPQSIMRTMIGDVVFDGEILQGKSLKDRVVDWTRLPALRDFQEERLGAFASMIIAVLLTTLFLGISGLLINHVIALSIGAFSFYFFYSLMGLGAWCYIERPTINLYSIGAFLLRLLFPVIFMPIDYRQAMLNQNQEEKERVQREISNTYFQLKDLFMEHGSRIRANLIDKINNSRDELSNEELSLEEQERLSNEIQKYQLALEKFFEAYNFYRL